MIQLLLNDSLEYIILIIKNIIIYSAFIRYNFVFKYKQTNKRLTLITGFC